MPIDEAKLLDDSKQQAYRRDVDPLSVVEIQHLLDQFRPSIPNDRRAEAGDALVRAYEDLVRSVRILRTGTVKKQPPIAPVERSHTPNSKKLTTRTAPEIAEVHRVVDELTTVMEKLSTPARRLIDDALRDTWRSSGIPPAKRRSLKQLWNEAFEPLLLIAAAADRVAIEIKAGPDQTALRQMVQTLATIWTEFTGDAPRRSYDDARRAKPSQSGEAGAFLELVREVNQLADKTLKKEGLGVTASSLSKIVRTVLNARPRTGPINS